jgi:hypothetical protein
MVFEATYLWLPRRHWIMRPHVGVSVAPNSFRWPRVGGTRFASGGEKLEARKMLVKRAESHLSASMMREGHSRSSVRRSSRDRRAAGVAMSSSDEPEQLVGLEDRILARA